MPSAVITATPYDGSVLAASLLDNSTNLLLSDFDPPVTGTVIDDDGTWSDADDGVSTFNGMPINYIGSGSATPGVSVGGILVPLGSTVDVVVFEAGGQTYFHYPDGPPNIVGSVLLNVQITAAPYTGITPVCFAEGTMISTPDGEVAIETLGPGDLVEDIHGKYHPIRWIMGRPMTLHDKFGPARQKLVPVLIPRDAFGPGMPHSDLRVSQQHLIYVRDPQVSLYFAEDAVLVPAKSLVGDRIRLESEARQVVYYHFLCNEHLIVRANGLPAETLRLGQVGLGSMSDVQRAELSAIFPELDAADPRMSPAAPVLSNFEGRVLSRAMMQIPLE